MKKTHLKYSSGELSDVFNNYKLYVLIVITITITSLCTFSFFSMDKAISTHSIPQGVSSVHSLCLSIHASPHPWADLNLQKEGISEAGQ